MPSVAMLVTESQQKPPGPAQPGPGGPPGTGPPLTSSGGGEGPPGASQPAPGGAQPAGDHAASEPAAVVENGTSNGTPAAGDEDGVPMDATSASKEEPAAASKEEVSLRGFFL